MPGGVLQGLVKRFFNEKEVTSTLVMDALFSGCKQLEEMSRAAETKKVRLLCCSWLSLHVPGHRSPGQDPSHPVQLLLCHGLQHAACHWQAAGVASDPSRHLTCCKPDAVTPEQGTKMCK